MAVAPKGCILLVDDDRAICDFMTLVLSDHGYEVITAANGQVALDRLTTVQPHLILLDLLMPVMSGQAFLQAYQALPSDRAPVVIFSAVTKAEAIASSGQANSCLFKPFDIQDLLDCVHQYCLQ
jgi:CheY-like chemotaxis protein